MVRCAMPYPRRVLLVEDNPGDVDLTRRAFRGLGVEFEVVNNGEAAVERMLDPEQPPPEMVLLDLNLPRLSGWEVLERVKLSSPARRVPIVILTSSDDEQDIVRSYERQASGYLTKPVTPESFRTLAGDFDRYWFGHSKLPTTS